MNKKRPTLQQRLADIAKRAATVLQFRKCPHCGARLVLVKKMWHDICKNCRKIVK